MGDIVTYTHTNTNRKKNSKQYYKIIRVRYDLTWTDVVKNSI